MEVGRVPGQWGGSWTEELGQAEVGQPMGSRKQKQSNGS